jgi:hypothetical protein
MGVLPIAVALNLWLSSAAPGQDRGTPETFSANAQVKGVFGPAVTALTIRIERFTTDNEREGAIRAFQKGGFAQLSAALRAGPALGYVEIGDRQWPIRYARQLATPQGRSIVAISDRPTFFVGGGLLDPKPRDSSDVAVVQFEVDEIGVGEGTMAAAARLKAGGPAGVEVDHYADEPIKLVTVRKALS